MNQREDCGDSPSRADWGKQAMARELVEEAPLRCEGAAGGT